MTASEKVLWAALRKLELNIRRQTPIGPYVADFAHHGAKLVIEIDGGRHAFPEVELKDAERDAWLMSQGYRTIRIQDERAFGASSDVAAEIAEEIRRRAAPPSPTLPPSRGKGA